MAFVVSSPRSASGEAPPIAGREAELLALGRQPGPVALPHTNLRFDAITSAFACALHMHQPSLPAGPQGAVISHLQVMLENPGEGDNHNAEPFAWCYRRMAELIPQLIAEGANPRIMLDYSGTLLWGFEQMGRHDILEALRRLACEPQLLPHVEWLGTFWGHAVAPSTPVADLKLQILAWQHHFAALFGDAALGRVKGFSPPEMHLPNDPDTLHAFVTALLDCGYRWLLVQEHSVETLAGAPLGREQTLVPNRLVARSSSGAVASITALIKTQGSDTKLVGQMQPYHEALGLGRQPLGSRAVPALVAQIADGENGGVMMNEFPPAFLQAHRRIAAEGGCRAGTVAVNGTEFLELLEAAGVTAADFPPIQAVHQHRLQQQPGDPAVALTGASWTNERSWVEGYANVLEPMQELSARFHAVFDPLVAADPAVTASAGYREALLHLLLLETSCFRYWGQGPWTDHARELHRRGMALLGDGSLPAAEA